MSVALDTRAAWQTRPGWGITVDLTPRQVSQTRQVRVHQRLIALGLMLVLVVCLGVSLLAHAGRSEAQRTYDEEQTRTAGLAAEVQQYADVAAMQTTTTRVQADLATVMGGDVDLVNLLARINQAVPAGVSVGDAAIVLTPPAAAETTTNPTADAADPTADAADPTASASDAAAATGQVVGTLTLSGSASQVSAVTPFVSALNRLHGAVDVLPTSVSATGEGAVTYTITMNLTDELYVVNQQEETP